MPRCSPHIEYTVRAADIRTDIIIIQRRAKSESRDKILEALRNAALAYDRLVAEEEGRS